MPTPESHVQKSERTYSGEEECKRLLDWLNAEKLTKPHQRVIRILEIYARLHCYWEKQVVKENGEIVEARYTRTDSPTYEELYKEIESRLFKYKFYPMILPIASYTKAGWYPAHSNKVARHLWLLDYGEYNAVNDIVTLGEMDLLNRLKRCACGKWIFMRFSHQNFCSTKCREDAFRSSPEWKEYRRKKAREYYKLHKSGKVK